MRVQNSAGATGVAPIECINPRQDTWRIRWAISKKDDGTATWLETDFDHQPSTDEIRSAVGEYYNSQTDQRILDGYTWQGNKVWLSANNQLNYKSAYDMAVQTEGKTLPVTFKFGTDDEPQYHTFTTVDELTDFYTGMVAHINACLQDGWKQKDSIDYNNYAI